MNILIDFHIYISIPLTSNRSQYEKSSSAVVQYLLILLSPDPVYKHILTFDITVTLRYWKLRTYLEHGASRTKIYNTKKNNVNELDLPLLTAHK